MKKLQIITYLLLFSAASVLIQAQEVKSEKASYFLSNKPKVEKTVVQDLTPPAIYLIDPFIEPGEVLRVDNSEILIIGKAIDESGISSIIVNSKFEDFTDNGEFISELILAEGENEIKLIVFDNESNVEKKTVLIEYVPPVLTFAEKVNKESIYYGLIIGIENYMDDDLNDLENPIDDAQLLYNVLINDYTFEAENVDIIKDATFQDISNSFQILSKKVTSNDNLLIFYAGHGWWDKNSSIGYWLPSDASDDNNTFWFRNSTLVDYLKEVKSKHTLLITDACFGGSIFRSRSAFDESPESYEMLYEYPSRKAMTSGNLSEVPDQSAFIKYLIKKLESNEEKYLGSGMLFNSFRHAVINNSNALPQYGEIRNVGDEGGEFIFIKK